jgi:hypothetical protein
VVDGSVPVEAVAFEWDRIRLLAHGAATICFGGSYEGPRLAKAAGPAPRDLRLGHRPLAGPPLFAWPGATLAALALGAWTTGLGEASGG